MHIALQFFHNVSIWLLGSLHADVWVKIISFCSVMLIKINFADNVFIQLKFSPTKYCVEWIVSSSTL